MNSNIHHIDATILKLNSQPSQSETYPQLRRRANGQLFDPLHPTQPEKVNAKILDLNGDPVDRNKPYPDLRRTASGYLFQPKTPAVPKLRLQSLKYHTSQSPDTVIATGQGPSISLHLTNETLEQKSIVTRHNLRPAFQGGRLTKEQPEQRNMTTGRDIPTHRTQHFTNKQLLERDKWTTTHGIRNWGNIPNFTTHCIVPSGSSSPQPQHLIIGNTDDSRAQFAPYANMYDADGMPSPNRPRASTAATQHTANLVESTERKETLRDRRVIELRNAEQKELRYKSSRRNLRAQFKLDGELGVDAVKERMREPLLKGVRHKIGRDDFYGTFDNSPSTRTRTVTNSVTSNNQASPKTMTVNNSKTGEKKGVRLNYYALPKFLTKEDESSGTESDDIWAQIARR